jgi:hypothetical protein
MTNSQRDQKIIEQAKAHLRTIANSETLRDRIMEAVKEDTLDAYWKLHTDLNEGSKESGNKFMNRLVDYRGVSGAMAFTDKLSAILRGERLEN